MFLLYPPSLNVSLKPSAFFPSVPPHSRLLFMQIPEAESALFILLQKREKRMNRRDCSPVLFSFSFVCS